MKEGGPRQSERVSSKAPEDAAGQARNILHAMREDMATVKRAIQETRAKIDAIRDDYNSARIVLAAEGESAYVEPEAKERAAHTIKKADALANILESFEEQAATLEKEIEALGDDFDDAGIDTTKPTTH